MKCDIMINMIMLNSAVNLTILLVIIKDQYFTFVIFYSGYAISNDSQWIFFIMICLLFLQPENKSTKN